MHRSPRNLFYYKFNTVIFLHLKTKKIVLTSSKIASNIKAYFKGQLLYIREIGNNFN